MAKVIFGKSEGKDISFDLEALLPTRLLIQANSGGGKSYAIRKIAEQASGKVQIIIVDFAGEFSTLREKYDFVLVGEGGETRIDIRSAGLLANRLLELKVSAVCDLYSLKPSDRHEWVKNFLEAMMNAPKKLWHPVLVIVDEAHKFMPEKGEGESVAKQAMLSLCSDGRKYGYCAVLATQRLAKLDKSGASELLNVMIGPTFIDVDLERAHKALGIVRSEWAEFDEQMKTTEPGHFWVLGRAVTKKRLLVKINPVETSHPESGKGQFAPPPMPANIAKLLPSLEDLPKEAETKAKTEADLRNEITNLKRQLVTRPTLTVPEVKVERVEVPVFQGGELDKLETIAEKFSDLSAQLTTASRDIFNAVKNIRSAPRQTPNASVVRPSERRIVPVRSTPLKQSAGNEPRLNKGEMVILTACGQYPEGVTKEQLTVMSGYKARTRNAYIQSLREKGLVQEQGRAAFITEAGFDVLGPDFEPLPTGDDLREYWINRLSGGERKILEILCSWYPNDIDKTLIDEQAGYKPRTRNAYLQNLAARKIVVSTSPSRVKASDSLFGS